MKIFNCLNKISKNKTYITTAIILSAGKGIRMNTSIPKQMIEIDSIPIIIRTLKTFELCAEIKDIILVVNKDNLDWHKEIINKYNITKKITYVLGGESRYESMVNGFEKVDEKTDFVCIHDGVRPFITVEDLTNIIQKAYRCNACIAVQKSTDTLKELDEKGIIKNTLNRNVIFRAQTPQVFKKEMLLVAIYKNNLDKNSITDDSILLENVGFKVSTYDCGENNIKITNQIDLELAENIINKEK